jgi:aryl-alcohol dehydrogenase-like predicted oxidoreductase
MAIIGLGLAALGRPGYINLGHGRDLAGDTEVASLSGRAHEVLDAAYAGGVRYYDAARSYGRAEEFLGSWLTARGFAPRADLTVASKWGYTYTANWRVDAEVNEVKELTVANLTRQLSESRALLGQYLGIYQIHSATIESGVLDDQAVLDELAQLRAGGLEIGFTSTGPHQAQTIRRAIEVGGFDVVQATWNLLEPSAGPALAEAHAAGLRVVIKEAVANGRLTDRGVISELLGAAQRGGVSADALALAVVLAQPWVDVVLSGATTVAMLTSNLAALDVSLSAEELAELGSLAVAPEVYWEQRSELPWN